MSSIHAVGPAGRLLRAGRGVAWTGLTILLGCGGAVSVNDTPAPAPGIVQAGGREAGVPREGGQTQERITVRGRFVVVFGDPPPESGQPPQRRYTLTDEEGGQWTLTFDEKVYTPPGGILSFNGKDVEVEGRRTGPDRLLVEAMRLR